MSSQTNLNGTAIGYIIRELYVRIAGTTYSTDEWIVMSSRLEDSSEDETKSLINNVIQRSGSKRSLEQVITAILDGCLKECQVVAIRSIFDCLNLPKLDVHFIVPYGIEAIATAVARQYNSFSPEQRARIKSGEDKWKPIEAFRKIEVLKTMTDEDAFKGAHGGMSIEEHFIIETDSRKDGHKHRGAGH